MFEGGELIAAVPQAGPPFTLFLSVLALAHPPLEAIATGVPTDRLRLDPGELGATERRIVERVVGHANELVRVGVGVWGDAAFAPQAKQMVAFGCPFIG